MNLTEITDKVKELGEQGVRAFWTFNNDPLSYRGDRGNLVVFEHLLFFVSDNIEKNWDMKDWIKVENANQIHAPSIGHYQW